jgi:hypothetical protein
MKANELETAVLAKLLEGDNWVLNELRKQLLGLTVTARTFTGVGFFVDFAIDPKIPAAPMQSKEVRISDVVGELGGLKHGAGFALLVEDGRLRQLEGFSYDEPWPNPVDSFALRFMHADRSATLNRLS